MAVPQKSADAHKKRQGFRDVGRSPFGQPLVEKARDGIFAGLKKRRRRKA
jgi:hypothetical protein